MDDGFNYFVLAIALGFILGIIAGAIFPSYALAIGLVAFVVMVLSYLKFMRTPVRGVEDDDQGEG